MAEYRLQWEANMRAEPKGVISTNNQGEARRNRLQSKKWKQVDMLFRHIVVNNAFERRWVLRLTLDGGKPFRLRSKRINWPLLLPKEHVCVPIDAQSKIGRWEIFTVSQAQMGSAAPLSKETMIFLSGCPQCSDGSPKASREKKPISFSFLERVMRIPQPNSEESEQRNLRSKLVVASGIRAQRTETLC